MGELYAVLGPTVGAGGRRLVVVRVDVDDDPPVAVTAPDDVRLASRWGWCAEFDSLRSTVVQMSWYPLGFVWVHWDCSLRSDVHDIVEPTDADSQRQEFPVSELGGFGGLGRVGYSTRGGGV